MSEWTPVDQPPSPQVPPGSRFVFVDSAGAYHIRGFFEQDPPDATHWLPLPPPPAPQLTVKEALREAVTYLECVTEIGIGNRYELLGHLLPRLRAALEAE